MSSTWSYQNPVSIRFGSGCTKTLGRELPKGPLLLITTAGMVRRGSAKQLMQEIGSDLDWHIIDTVTPNPEVKHLLNLSQKYRDSDPGAVIAFGGGSSIDTGKVLSALLRAPDDFDLNRFLAGDLPLPEISPIPCIAIPTTSGTGAEVTPFATLWSVEDGKKFSFASPSIFPKAAWLDPEYTTSLSKDVTISTSLDAFSQALESLWNRNSTPYSRMLATRSASLAFTGLLQISEAWPIKRETRHTMMEASLLAGLAISQTRTALAHSISYPITARFGMPHGLACSFMLPELFKFNAIEDDGSLLELAKFIGCSSIVEFAVLIEDLLCRLGVPAFVAGYIPSRKNLLSLVPEMFTPGRSDNNLRPVDQNSVGTILEETWSRLFSKR